MSLPASLTTLELPPALYHGAVVGDSLTDAWSGYPSPHKSWPCVLEKFLRLRGCRIALANFAHGGAFTADFLAFLPGIFRYGIPPLVGVYGAVNDAGYAGITVTTLGTVGTKSVQKLGQNAAISPGSFIGGTFSLTYGASTASGIAINTTAATLQTKLNELASITTAGGVTCTGGPLGTGEITITFNNNGVQTAFVPDRKALTTLYTQAILMAVKHACFGLWDTQGEHRGRQILGPSAVNEPSQLPIRGNQGARIVVLKDNAASSGATPPAWMVEKGLAVANVGEAGGGGLSVWECRNPHAGEYGWGRVHLSGEAPSARWTNANGESLPPFIFCIDGSHYLNYTNTEGDTPSARYAQNAAIREATRTAIEAELATVSGLPTLIRTNLYGFERRRITGSAGGYTSAVATDPNFSSDTSIVPTVAYEQARSWHFHLEGTTNNVHHNNYGHGIVADAVIDGGPGTASGSTAADDTASPQPSAIPASWFTALGGS